MHYGIRLAKRPCSWTTQYCKRRLFENAEHFTARGKPRVPPELGLAQEHLVRAEDAQGVLIFSNRGRGRWHVNLYPGALVGFALVRLMHWPLVIGWRLCRLRMVGYDSIVGNVRIAQIRGRSP